MKDKELLAQKQNLRKVHVRGRQIDFRICGGLGVDIKLTIYSTKSIVNYIVAVVN